MNSPILIDLDGVVIDLHKVWIERFNKKMGIELMREDDIVKWGRPDHLTDDQARIWFDTLRDEDLYDFAMPLPGAQYEITVLETLGYDIAFVTSCVSVGMIAAKVRWLSKFGLAKVKHPGGFPSNLTICHGKGCMGGLTLIDDGPHNIMNWTRSNLDQGILFDQPWNRALEDPLIKRAKGWKEVTTLIKEMYPHDIRP